jgi:hypothetical protein
MDAHGIKRADIQVEYRARFFGGQFVTLDERRRVLAIALALRRGLRDR